MKRIVLVLVILTVAVVQVHGADTHYRRYSYHQDSMEYYVSQSGSDENPGTIDKPFRTIQKAADIMLPDDTCYVRQRTYRETVSPVHCGMFGRPLRFEAYPGEIVTLSGAEPLDGNWSMHKGSIYKTKVDREFTQLFVDGEMMIEARWPNARFDQLLDKKTWAYVDKGSTYGLINDAELAKTGIDWTGAIATPNVSHQFSTWAREVRNHARGKNSFEYDRNLNLTYDVSWEDDKYFLLGKLEALDISTEWYLDTQTQTLYLWTPEGDSPANHTVEVKVRDYAFELTGKDYIRIAGFLS